MKKMFLVVSILIASTVRAAPRCVPITRVRNIVTTPDLRITKFRLKTGELVVTHCTGLYFPASFDLAGRACVSNYIGGTNIGGERFACKVVGIRNYRK